jgi:hypothetical protein
VGDSLIAKSGQLGSFRYGVASLVAGTVVMMAAPRIHETIPIYLGYPFGVLLAIGGAVFLVTGIRCPRCHTRIIWDALRRHPGDLHEAVTGGSCRNCGHLADSV